ncbi:MAG: 2TM domain-containing protein [Anaerolineae bacterium]|nr:2TM domain-containing protein [Anaerolineae bacterium]MDW8297934.1 2TM domain-containing protein [Anaerolineae bacterium]
MDDERYLAARKAAEKRVKSRVEFYQHLAAYVMVNAMLAIAFNFPFWMIFVTFGWGAGLLAHGIEVFFDDPLRRERAVAREMEKLGYKPTDVETEKPKRDRLLTLGDDGELVELDELESRNREDGRMRR